MTGLSGEERKVSRSFPTLFPLRPDVESHEIGPFFCRLRRAAPSDRARLPGVSRPLQEGGVRASNGLEFR
jgi:hypothetical protein